MEQEERERSSSTFESFLQQLGVERSLIDNAVASLEKLRENYCMGGDSKVWFVSALYEQICGKTTSVSVSPTISEILQVGEISFPDFFNKAKKWAEVSDHPEFSDHLGVMEANFNVNMVVYQKFKIIFSHLFAQNLHYIPASGEFFTISDLFEFTWLFNVHIRCSFSNIRDDIVNSFHVMLCCLDFVYAGILNAGRLDLLNLEFPGLPQDLDVYLNAATLHTSNYSVLELLCSLHDGLVKDCLSIQQHWFNSCINALHEETSITHNFFVSKEVFLSNLTFLNNTYEQKLKNKFTLDERIFSLNETRTMKFSLLIPANSQLANTCITEVHTHTSTRDTSPIDEGFEGSADYSIAIQSVLRLQAILVGFSNEPSQSLLECFHECSALTAEEISTRVSHISELFARFYRDSLPLSESDQPVLMDSGVNDKLYYMTCLYYKIMDDIVQSELSRIKTNQKIFVFNLLHKESFHRSLICCCMEIVLFSYKSKKTFPWFLDVMQLQSYEMYRVIETVVRLEEGFSREVIKHLNWVEERILEEIVWTKGSSLLVELNLDNPNPNTSVTIPFCCEVLLASQMPNGQALRQKHGKSGSSNFSERPKQVSPLALFFRKFYLLSSARLRELIYRIDPSIEKSELRKIWSVFEYSVTQKPWLFVNRHLDQIILCCVYIMGRLQNKSDWLFENIINAYRMQSQASRLTYRSVLIRTLEGFDHSIHNPNYEIREDIVAFYNQVFVRETLGFAKQFATGLSGTSANTLGTVSIEEKNIANKSVLPIHRKKLQTARKPSVCHNLYLLPLKGKSEGEAKEFSGNGNITLSYRFSISPSKNLKDINSFVQSNEIAIAGSKKRKISPDAFLPKFTDRFIKT